MNDDPRWQAFYAVLQVNARVVDRVGGAHRAGNRTTADAGSRCSRCCATAPAACTTWRTGSRCRAGEPPGSSPAWRRPALSSREITARRTGARPTPRLHRGRARRALERAQPVHLAAVEEFFGAHLEPARRQRTLRARPARKARCRATSQPSRSRSTSAPAGSGPEPWGATANPSLSPSAPVMCEPWRSVGMRLEHAVGGRARTSRSGTSCARPTGRRARPSRPRSSRGPASRSPAQPPQRGDDEQRHADDRRQRVARQPEHERARRGGRTTAACRA